MSNHFKGSDNNPNKNSDGSDHNRSGQSSNSGGFDHATWLKIMKGNDSQKIDVVATTASTRIDTELWEHIDNENGPSELNNRPSDSSTRKTAEQILKDVQNKNETTAQNTSTDYTSLFMNSMRSLLKPFTSRAPEIPTQTTNDTSLPPQNNNQAKRQTKRDNQFSHNNNASSSSKPNYHSRTQSSNSANNQRRTLSGSLRDEKKKSPPSRTSSINLQHFRSDSTGTHYSSRAGSVYSLGGRDKVEYGFRQNSGSISGRTMDSIRESVHTMWGNLRHPKREITDKEREICARHALDIKKKVLDFNDTSGFLRAKKDLEKKRVNLENGERTGGLRGINPKDGTKLPGTKTEGIRSVKFNALSNQDKEDFGLGLRALPESQRKLKDIKSELEQWRDKAGKYAEMKNNELKQAFDEEKATFDENKIKYDKVSGELERQIKEEIEKNSDYQTLKSNFDRSLEEVIKQVDLVRADVESAGNPENSGLYIAKKIQMYKNSLEGTKLSADQQAITGLATRERELNVPLVDLSEDNPDKAKLELIEYHVREHINFVTAFKDAEKYEFTGAHKDKFLTAMVRNAESLEVLVNPISEDPEQIKD